ncbi:hypothetical protein AB0P21_18315 [Kribbella sp. NPDC056861]|uniref:hypothetical protein n=1 Tax=Kribbella sp. NPDC056861 TaxID=3154857 RepID=UPI003439CD88
MRSPRLVYGVVAAILVVAGFVLPRYLADRSAPELGDTIVIPASSSATPTPTPGPTVRPTDDPDDDEGAEPVSPRPVRTAGDDDRDDPDDLDDDD